jgi:hypothetical protein
MIRPAGTHWPSIILFCIIAFGALALVTFAFAAGFDSIAGLFDDLPDSTGSMISSVASGFETILLGGCAWFILQKVMSRAPGRTGRTRPHGPAAAESRSWPYRRPGRPWKRG